MSASHNPNPLSPDFLQRQQRFTEISAALEADLEAACGELELLEQIKKEFLRRGQESPKDLEIEICDDKNKIDGVVQKYEQAYDELKRPVLQRREAATETLDAIRKEMGELRAKLQD